MNSAIFRQDPIIQLELFQNKQLRNNLLIPIMGIGLLGMIVISGLANYYFEVGMTSLSIGVLLLVAVFLLLLSQYPTYFYTDSLTLVIAFGEFQLMEKNRILWRKKIEQLNFQHKESSPMEIPIILIKSTSLSPIAIGYGRPKNKHSKRNIDYLIFSKLDWNILKKYTESDLRTKLSNDNPSTSKYSKRNST